MTDESDARQAEILSLLGAAFQSEFNEEGRRIRALTEESLPAVLDALTLIERRPGLPASLFGLVARAKLALRGKQVDEYMTAVMRHGGLLAEDETWPPPPDSPWWSHGSED